MDLLVVIGALLLMLCIAITAVIAAWRAPLGRDDPYKPVVKIIEVTRCCGSKDVLRAGAYRTELDGSLTILQVIPGAAFGLGPFRRPLKSYAAGEWKEVSYAD